MTNKSNKIISGTGKVGGSESRNSLKSTKGNAASTKNLLPPMRVSIIEPADV